MTTKTVAMGRLLLGTVVALGVGNRAQASCGIPELAARAATAGSARAFPRSPTGSPGNAPNNQPGFAPSIVGLWHTTLFAGTTPIQEAFQLWNTGGTEVHNPNVDPRQGNVCLGVWKEIAPGTFALTHRVWSWDTNGTFLGTLHLSEVLTPGSDGSTFTGSWTLDIYDPFGTFVVELSGTATGERISVGDQ